MRAIKTPSGTKWELNRFGPTQESNDWVFHAMRRNIVPLQRENVMTRANRTRTAISQPPPGITPLGPTVFGRGVVVDDLSQLDGWPAADRERLLQHRAIIVDDETLSDPLPTIRALQHRWDMRIPGVVVFRTAEANLYPGKVSAGRSIPEPARHVFAKASAKELLSGEYLHHLVFSNNYDMRHVASGEAALWGVTRGRLWRPTKGFVQDPTSRPDHWTLGDVKIDGQAVWIDGGPRASFSIAQLNGCRVIHRTALLFHYATTGNFSMTTCDRYQEEAMRTPHDGFTDDQLDAVRHVGGAARVLAPAGAGKTRVVTERLRTLVHAHGHSPLQIVAVAFNKAAAEEMAVRTGIKTMHFATLNSLGYSIVRGGNGFVKSRRHDTTFGTRLVDIGDAQFRSLLTRIFFPKRKGNVDRQALLDCMNALARVRMEFVSPEVAGEEVELSTLNESTFQKFETEMLAAGMTDFPGQIYNALHVMLRDPVARYFNQLRAATLVVDEAQDLLPAHRALIDLLAGPATNIMFVGDMDQTIYEYNGADPASLRNLVDDLPDCARYQLVTNFRCPPYVVQQAGLLVREIEIREDVTISSHPQRTMNDNDIVMLATHPNREVPDTANHLASLLQSGVNPDDIAVLCRVNKLLLPMQIALVAKGIPATGLVASNLLHDADVRRTLALIRMASNVRVIEPKDAEQGFWGSAFVNGYVDFKSMVAKPMHVNDILRSVYRVESLRKFFEAVRDLGVLMESNTSTEDVLASIRETFQQHQTSERTNDKDARLDEKTTERAVDGMKPLEMLADYEPNPKKFPQWLISMFQQCESQDPARGAITLSTMHRTKGQEWPYVVLLCMNDGLMPMGDDSQRDQERRLGYVGLTRAKQRLIIAYDHTAPSPFLGTMNLLEKARPPASLGPDLAQL